MNRNQKNQVRWKIKKYSFTTFSPPKKKHFQYKLNAKCETEIVAMLLFDINWKNVNFSNFQKKRR